MLAISLSGYTGVPDVNSVERMLSVDSFSRSQLMNRIINPWMNIANVLFYDNIESFCTQKYVFQQDMSIVSEG